MITVKKKPTKDCSCFGDRCENHTIEKFEELEKKLTEANKICELAVGEAYYDLVSKADHNKAMKNQREIHEVILTKVQDQHDELLNLLKEFQSSMGYASPWWIKIESVINPNNPALKQDKEY